MKEQVKQRIIGDEKLIRELTEKRDQLYEKLKDLTTIDSATCDVCLDKMKKINRQIYKLSRLVEIAKLTISEPPTQCTQEAK